jgi:hypothetical protein
VGAGWADTDLEELEEACVHDLILVVARRIGGIATGPEQSCSLCLRLQRKAQRGFTRLGSRGDFAVSSKEVRPRRILQMGNENHPQLSLK